MAQPAVGFMTGGLGVLGGLGGRTTGLGVYGLYGGAGLGLYGGIAPGLSGGGVYGVAGAYGGTAYGVAGASGSGVYGASGSGVYGASGSSGYGSYYEDAYGGFLRGNADVIGATGRFLVNQQDADRGREQVRQARIDTRRKVFDEYLYERTHTPTVEDERERLQALQVRRAVNDPPVTEIWSAKALNDLLRDAQKLQAQGAGGPRLELDAVVLRRINVVAGRRPGNLGLLKDQGKLTWPAALQSLSFAREAEDPRQQVAELLPRAVSQAVNGLVDPPVLVALHRAVAKLDTRLAQEAGRLPPNAYIQARRYLNDLFDGLRALGQPDAGQYLTARRAARGRTVPELVEHMTQEGLEFAPAVVGDEAAYVALHRALAAYDAAVHGQATLERASDKQK
jgi:hypothetical protein